VKEEPLTVEESLALLRENASRLASVTDGLPLERLHAASQLDDWSPHVRQIERTLTLADAALNEADIATTMSRD
jgi:hypothetical protein